MRSNSERKAVTQVIDPALELPPPGEKLDDAWWREVLAAFRQVRQADANALATLSARVDLLEKRLQ